jgi:amidohydrolase
MGCEVDITIRHLTIPTVNHPEVTERLRGVFAGMVAEEHLDTDARTMASEDVAFMMEEIPGTYFFVGSGNAARGLTYGHHHPRFDFDEAALPLGVALMAAALADYVIPDGK